MPTSCNCERGPLGTIVKLCADHEHYEQKRCHGLIAENERLRIALAGLLEAPTGDLYTRTEQNELMRAKDDAMRALGITQ